MIQSANQEIIYFTWRAIFWRVVVTLLLLFFLAAFGLTIFDSATTQPDAHVLPTFSFEATVQNQQSDFWR